MLAGSGQVHGLISWSVLEGVEITGVTSGQLQGVTFCVESLQLSQFSTGKVPFAKQYKVLVPSCW